MNILIYATLSFNFFPLGTRNRISGSEGMPILRLLIIITQLLTLTHIFSVSFLLGKLDKNFNIRVLTMHQAFTFISFEGDGILTLLTD